MKRSLAPTARLSACACFDSQAIEPPVESKCERHAAFKLQRIGSILSATPTQHIRRITTVALRRVSGSSIRLGRSRRNNRMWAEPNTSLFDQANFARAVGTYHHEAAAA